MTISTSRPRAPVSASLALVVLSGALVACLSPTEPAPERLAQASQAVINGVASGAADDSAIRLQIFENGMPYASCSGVLVAPNLVLTARHCVSVTDDQFGCDETGKALVGAGIYSNLAPSDLGVIIGGAHSDVLAARGAELFTLPDKVICNRDIAFLRLDTPITNVPFAQMRLDAPPTRGEAVRVVGYGFSNTSTNDPRSRNRRDGVPIIDLGPLTVSSLRGVGNHEFLVGESVCRGDSGGPAYAEKTHVVLGVASQGGNGKKPDATGSDCIDDGVKVTTNIFTRVDAFPELIAEAFAAAGTEPWKEGGYDPRKAKFAESCRLDDDCRSAACTGQSADAAGYCTHACDDTPASCPDTMRCESTTAGTRYCVVPSPIAQGVRPSSSSSASSCSLGPRRGSGGELPSTLALCALLLVRRRARAALRGQPMRGPLPGAGGSGA